MGEKQIKPKHTAFTTNFRPQIDKRHKESSVSKEAQICDHQQKQEEMRQNPTPSKENYRTLQVQNHRNEQTIRENNNTICMYIYI